MKRSILVVAMAFLGVAGAKAQTMNESTMPTEKNIQFGVKGGINFSSFAGNDFNSPDYRTNFYAGLVGELPFNDFFSLQAEAFYSGQGFDESRFDQDNFLDNDGNIEYQLDYINVPVLAKIYLVDGLSVQAGPSFNFKVNEELDYEPFEDGGDVDLDNAQDFEIGGVVGLEYKFNNGFFIQGRYNYGFTDVIKDSNLHNSVFQAGVGFMF